MKNTKSFGGWYISGEISRKTKGAIDFSGQWENNARMSLEASPTFISPWIDEKKAVMGTDKLTKKKMQFQFRNMKESGMRFLMGFMKWLMLVLFRMGTLTMMNWMLFYSE